MSHIISQSLITTPVSHFDTHRRFIEQTGKPGFFFPANISINNFCRVLYISSYQTSSSAILILDNYRYCLFKICITCIHRENYISPCTKQKVSILPFDQINLRVSSHGEKQEFHLFLPKTNDGGHLLQLLVD